MNDENHILDPDEHCEFCGNEDDRLEYAFDCEGRMLLLCGSCKAKVEKEVNPNA